MSQLRRTFKKIFSLCGYDVRSLAIAHDTQNSRRFGEAFEQVKKLGFHPKTAIDVGIADGTPDIYKIFPTAHHLLIDPLTEYENTMKSILKKYPGSYVLAAAGSKSGTLELNVHLDHLASSSPYVERDRPKTTVELRKVPVVTIDDIVKERKLAGPYLIKADVQGAELDVLEGAQETLKETEFIMLEVSLFEVVKDTPQFYDVVYYMKNHGFVVYDIVWEGNRPSDNALVQVDIAFVKENGQFRKNHSLGFFL